MATRLQLPSHITAVAQLPNATHERRTLNSVILPVAFTGKVRFLRFLLTDDDVPIEGDTLGTFRWKCMLLRKRQCSTLPGAASHGGRWFVGTDAQGHPLSSTSPGSSR